LLLPVKGKAIPLQAWTGPEVSRKLRFQISWQRHRMLVCCQPCAPAVLIPANTPGTHFC